MKSRIILLFMSLFLINAAFAQKKLTREQLIADADSLYARIYDIHPDMFAVLPQIEFEKELERIKTQFEDSMTILDFYRRINPLVVRLGDGHTHIYVTPNMSDNGKKTVLPVNVSIDKENYTLTVEGSYADTPIDLPVGAKIVSINGRNTKDILREFLRHASGENELFRFERVKYYFPLFLFIVYGDHTMFTITYELGGVEKMAVVDGITLKEFREAEQKERDKEQETRQNYSLTINENTSTAIIDFRSFIDFDKFSLFIDSTFSVIKDKNIQNLIIDIRNNGGGNSMLGDELFQYISPVPFQQFGRSLVKISPTLKRIEDDITYPLGFHSSEGDLIPLRENDKRFTGNCYLLTSNYTFSSAGSFTWAFHYFRMGKIIGEETGGLIVCFGDVITSSLPHTGIRLGVSYKKFYGYGADDSHTHGVKPDYEVPAEQAMDFAIKLIENSK